MKTFLLGGNNLARSWCLLTATDESDLGDGVFPELGHLTLEEDVDGVAHDAVADDFAVLLTDFDEFCVHMATLTQSKDSVVGLDMRLRPELAGRGRWSKGQDNSSWSALMVVKA